MYKLVGGIFFWLISVSVLAQVKITVSDKTSGNKIEGVAISVKEGNTLGISDEQGTAELSITKFPVTLVVTHITYKSSELTIDRAGEYELVLEPGEVTMEELVVTGQFQPQSLRQSVYQVRTISNERIMMRSPVSIQGVLSTELGIRFSNDLTLGVSNISLMGMGGQNVKVLLDGIPLLDRGEARESLNQIDINTIERIEIVEGPMSVMYGTDALAGVINVITKQNKSSLSVEARVHEETAGDEYEGFTGKGVHNQSVGIDWKGKDFFKNFYAGALVTRNTFGGWRESRRISDNPDGAGEWHPKDQWLTQSSVGFKNKKNTFDIWYRLNYMHEVIAPQGNPVNDVQIQVVDKDYITNRFNHQLQADWSINDKLSFNGAATYQDYSRRTMTTNYNLITGEETLSTEAGSQTEALFDMAMVRGMFHYKLSNKVSLQPGFDFNFSSGSGDRIDRNRSINDYAAFISSEIRLTEKINIRPGFRFIYNSVYDAPPVIPSINTLFALSDKFDLRLSYAYGFRSPALRELYFYFFDASHSIKGNPDLKAEHSNSFTGSLTWNHKRGNWRMKSNLGAFYNEFDNMIAIGYDPANPSVNMYVNILKFKTTGSTLENFFYWKNLSFSVGGSYIGRYNQFTEEDSELPELLWSTELNANAGYTFKKINNTISLYYKYTGRRQSYAINTTTQEVALGEVEAFGLLDVTVSQKLLKYLTLTVGVRNALDVTQLQNTTQDSGGAHSTTGSVPMSYGRSYFTALAFKWTK